MKPLMFKVRYGFDRMATLSIEVGQDLEKAIYAWTEQIPVTIGGKMIQGKHIISIEPDYHFYTGWYESYSPSTGDDFKQIERDCPNSELFENSITAYRQRVMELVGSGNTNQIGKLPPLQLEEVKSAREGSGFAKRLLAKKKVDN